jgi:hypothetical protein
MVTLPTWLVSTDFGTCSYQSPLSNFTPSSLHMLKCNWAHTLSCHFMYCSFANIGYTDIMWSTVSWNWWHNLHLPSFSVCNIFVAYYYYNKKTLFSCDRNSFTEECFYFTALSVQLHSADGRQSVCMEHLWNDNDNASWSTQRKTYPHATLTTKSHVAWPGIKREPLTISWAIAWLRMCTAYYSDINWYNCHTKIQDRLMQFPIYDPEAMLWKSCQNLRADI